MPVHNRGGTYRVAVLMGSPNDRPKMDGAVQILTSAGCEVHEFPLSAHRDPSGVSSFVSSARGNNFVAIIAGAGMAAHLAGACAAQTTLPVVGVPLSGGSAPLASTLSTSEMPPGIPVGTMAVDGSLNAGLYVLSMISVTDPAVAEWLVRYRRDQRDLKDHFVGEVEA